MSRVALKDFLDTMGRPKTWVASAAIGVGTALTAWWMSLVSLAAAASEVPPQPILLWHMGAQGVLVALGFGLFPLFLSLLPIIVVYDALKKDRSTGFLEIVFSRPVPRWVLGLGKAGGVYGALAVIIVAIVLVMVLTIQTMLGTSLPLNLVLVVVGVSLLLTALYVLLGLLLTPVISAGQALFLLMLLWITFNTLSRDAFVVIGQFLLIVPIGGPHSFQAMWTDMFSFTGAYTGLFAAFIPDSLNFVSWPPWFEWEAHLAAWAAVYVGFVWVGLLLPLYLAAYQRLGVVRRV